MRFFSSLIWEMEGFLIIAHKIKHFFDGIILKTKLWRGVVIHAGSSYIQINVV